MKKLCDLILENWIFRVCWTFWNPNFLYTEKLRLEIPNFQFFGIWEQDFFI